MVRAAMAAVLFALVIGSAVAGSDAPRSVDNVRLVDLDGRVWDAERLRGRVTLIDFWATWCAPCLTELPYLKEARRRFNGDGFEILGVSFDFGDRRTFVSWLNRQSVDWPQVFDGRGFRTPAARQFGVTAVPASFLVDAKGRIVARNLRGERLLAAIEAVVRQRVTSTSSFDAARVPIVTR